MLKIKLLCVLFLLGVGVSSAQWEWLNPLPQGNKLNKVSFADPDHGTAVGLVGTILHTSDGGSTWTIQPSGLTTALLDVAFVDANIGTIVGGAGIILQTTDGGENWITRNSGITTALRGVSFSNVNNGTAVGAGGKILRTTDGGATWVSQTSGTTSFLYSVSFSDSLTGTAVGANGTIRHTTDAGATWTGQTSGITGILWSVSFPDNDHGTVVGDNDKIIHTTDGGITWTQQASQGGGYGALYGVAFTDINNGWIVGNQIGETIQHTTDGGNTWVSQYFQIYPSLWGISAANSNDAVAVGYVGSILTTNDGGSNWSNRVHGTQNVLGPIVFPTANIGYVGGTYGLIQKTTDSGLSWVNQTSGVTNSMFYGMHFVNENTGTAVSAGGDIVSTTNGGSTWNVQSSGTTDFLYGVALTSVTRGFVVGIGGTLLLTTNGGNTWVNQTSPLSSMAGISFGDSLNGTIVGNGVIHTTDGGASWTSQTSGTSNYLWAVHFVDANTGTAVGDAGTIIHTTDGGASWLTQTSGTANDLWGVRFADANNGTAAGDLGVIVQTTDGGLNWTVEQSPTGNFLNGVAYPTPGTCIVVGEGGSILAKRSAVAPLPPSDLFAVADTFSVDLSWTDNSDNESGFKIERKDDSLSVPGTWTLVDSVGANGTAYTDTGLTPNTVYSYRVYAYNAAGNSEGDSVQTVTVVPVEFLTFTASAAGSEVILNWSTATETNNRGFDIERSQKLKAGQAGWMKVGYSVGNGTTTEPKSYSFKDNDVNSGKYNYRLKQIDFNGTFSYSNAVKVNVTGPDQYSLSQNYPNPFNPATVIKYSIPSDGMVKLNVYNTLGQKVAELINGQVKAGSYEVNFNADNLSSGVYYYRIETTGFVSTKKMMLLR